MEKTEKSKEKAKEEVKEEKQIVEKVVLNVEQANKLLNYLADRPYKEVVMLIDTINHSIIRET